MQEPLFFSFSDVDTESLYLAPRGEHTLYGGSITEPTCHIFYALPQHTAN
jgi:hypothetical protein